MDNPSLAVTDEVLDCILDESYDPVYGVRTIKRWLEKKVVTCISRMLIREEIDENSTVYTDARLNGSELVYRIEKNGRLVDVVTGQKSDVLIHLSKEPRSTDAHQAMKKMKIEEMDKDHDMDE